MSDDAIPLVARVPPGAAALEPPQVHDQGDPQDTSHVRTMTRAGDSELSVPAVPVCVSAEPCMLVAPPLSQAPRPPRVPCPIPTQQRLTGMAQQPLVSPSPSRCPLSVSLPSMCPDAPVASAQALVQPLAGFRDVPYGDTTIEPLHQRNAPNVSDLNGRSSFVPPSHGQALHPSVPFARYACANQSSDQGPSSLRPRPICYPPYSVQSGNREHSARDAASTLVTVGSNPRARALPPLPPRRTSGVPHPRRVGSNGSKAAQRSENVGKCDALQQMPPPAQVAPVGIRDMPATASREASLHSSALFSASQAASDRSVASGERSNPNSVPIPGCVDQECVGDAKQSTVGGSGPQPVRQRTPTQQRRPRKPYKITRTRETWTDEEHQRFLVALQMYERDWKRIGAHVGTKTVLQIRSHAQKHFGKVTKFNTGEYIPPARHKRRASNPYPRNVSPPAMHGSASGHDVAGSDALVGFNRSEGHSVGGGDSTHPHGDSGAGVATLSIKSEPGALRPRFISRAGVGQTAAETGSQSGTAPQDSMVEKQTCPTGGKRNLTSGTGLGVGSAGVRSGVRSLLLGTRTEPSAPKPDAPLCSDVCEKPKNVNRELREQEAPVAGQVPGLSNQSDSDAPANTRHLDMAKAAKSVTRADAQVAGTPSLHPFSKRGGSGHESVSPSNTRGVGLQGTGHAARELAIVDQYPRRDEEPMLRERHGTVHRVHQGNDPPTTSGADAQAGHGSRSMPGFRPGLRPGSTAGVSSGSSGEDAPSTVPDRSGTGSGTGSGSRSGSGWCSRSGSGSGSNIPNGVEHLCVGAVHDRCISRLPQHDRNGIGASQGRRIPGEVIPDSTQEPVDNEREPPQAGSRACNSDSRKPQEPGFRSKEEHLVSGISPFYPYSYPPFGYPFHMPQYYFGHGPLYTHPVPHPVGPPSTPSQPPCALHGHVPVHVLGYPAVSYLDPSTKQPFLASLPQSLSHQPPTSPAHPTAHPVAHQSHGLSTHASPDIHYAHHHYLLQHHAVAQVPVPAALVELEASPQGVPDWVSDEHHRERVCVGNDSGDVHLDSMVYARAHPGGQYFHPSAAPFLSHAHQRHPGSVAIPFFPDSRFHMPNVPEDVSVRTLRQHGNQTERDRNRHTEAKVADSEAERKGSSIPGEMKAQSMDVLPAQRLRSDRDHNLRAQVHLGVNAEVFRSTSRHQVARKGGASRDSGPEVGRNGRGGLPARQKPAAGWAAAAASRRAHRARITKNQSCATITSEDSNAADEHRLVASGEADNGSGGTARKMGPEGDSTRCTARVVQEKVLLSPEVIASGRAISGKGSTRVGERDKASVCKAMDPAIQDEAVAGFTSSDRQNDGSGDAMGSGSGGTGGSSGSAKSVGISDYGCLADPISSGEGSVHGPDHRRRLSITYLNSSPSRDIAAPLRPGKCAVTNTDGSSNDASREGSPSSVEAVASVHRSLHNASLLVRQPESAQGRILSQPSKAPEKAVAFHSAYTFNDQGVRGPRAKGRDPEFVMDDDPASAVRDGASPRSSEQAVDTKRQRSPSPDSSEENSRDSKPKTMGQPPRQKQKQDVGTSVGRLARLPTRLS